MSEHYLMPALGSGMTSGTVIEWYVEPGKVVRRGEVIGLVDTDKGAIEIEVWNDAEVVEILAPPGTKAPVGEPLLALREVDGARAPERARASPAARTRAAEEGLDLAAVQGTGPGGAVTLPDVERAVEERKAAERPAAEVPEAEEVADERREAAEPPGEPVRGPKATPVARKVAESLGIPLEGIEGTGPGGAITRQDVEAAADGRVPPDGAEAARAAEAAADEKTAPRPDAQLAMRRAIAAAMARSKREIPHYYLATPVPVEKALRWVEERNRDRPPAERVLPVALHLKAVAVALGEYPELNGFWEDGELRPADRIHPGLAISLRGGGLVAPAIHDVQEMSLDRISTHVRELVQRARTARLRASEVADATITLTSLGDRGVDTVYGVIYPPQVAIVGVGAPRERPWAEDGMLGVRRVVQLTLAADHRASDGHRGGLFLDRVAELLQSPESL
jgi:pyruvate dehydrogenase E2 component (dihydrolipoamide acetyltransferase)